MHALFQRTDLLTDTLLSVNFGFASLLSATISMYHPDFVMNAWQLLLVFWAVCLLSLFICAFCNRWLPHVDSKPSHIKHLQ